MSVNWRWPSHLLAKPNCYDYDLEYLLSMLGDSVEIDPLPYLPS